MLSASFLPIDEFMHFIFDVVKEFLKQKKTFERKHKIAKKKNHPTIISLNTLKMGQLIKRGYGLKTAINHLNSRLL